MRWLLRGGVLAVAHAAADTVVAQTRISDPGALTTTRAVVLALLVGLAAVWAAVDGWLRVTDRGKAWLYGSLFAGIAAAVLSAIAKTVFVGQAGTNDLGAALTGGAAFTALLILLPAGLGLGVGKLLDPPRPVEPDPDDPDALDADPDVDTAEEPVRRRHARRRGTTSGRRSIEPDTVADDPDDDNDAATEPAQPRPRPHGSKSGPRSSEPDDVTDDLDAVETPAQPRRRVQRRGTRSGPRS